jgi:bla regulator protein blaR1
MTDAFLDSTLVTGLVAALLIVLRRPMLAAFGPEWTYASWVLPVLPAIPLRMPALPSLDPGGVLSGSAGAVYTVTANFEQQVASSVDLAAVALWVWALGAVALFAWGVSRYAYLVQLLRDSEQVSEYEGMPVETAAVPVPMTVGVFTPRIIVPATLWTATDDAGRSKILAHEAVHAQRRDVLWNLIGFGLLCLHWFNPVAWLAYRSMRRDQELSCDARVTGSSSDGDRARYARLLVEVVAAQPVSAAPAMAADLKRLEERIKMIWRHRARPAVTRTALIALVAAGAAMSGLRAGAADAVRFSDDEQLRSDDQEVNVTVFVRKGDAPVASDDEVHTVTVDVTTSGDGAEESDLHMNTWVNDDGSEYAFGDSEEEVTITREMVREMGGGDVMFGPGVMLDLSIQRGGLTTSPSIGLPYGAEGMIELRDSTSDAPIALALEVREASTGTAEVVWTVREESAGSWVDVANGSQFVTLGEEAELVTGQSDTRITLTASESAPHEE